MRALPNLAHRPGRRLRKRDLAEADPAKLPSPAVALTIVCWLLATTPWLSAAIVTFEIIPTNDSTTNEVIVEPGVDVPYILTALITYEGTEADNAGLAFFSLDLRTDLRVPQPPIDSFDPDIALAFPILQSRGTPREGPVAGITQDVLQIGGSQNTFAGTQAILNVALLQTQVLGQGRLLTPDVEGNFVATLLDSSNANVFRPDSNSVFEPQIALGPSLRITTEAPADGDGDGDTDGDTDGQNGNGETPTTQPTTTQPIQAAAYLTLFAVIAGLIGIALWGGPLLLWFGPVLLAILLVMLCLGQW